MSPGRWRRVKALFTAVVDEPPRARDRLLAVGCRGDLALRAEVECLLAAEATEESLLDTEHPGVAAVLDGMSSQIPDDGPSPTDHHIGPYRLEREIGRGGMSVVYLAVRDDAQYHRRVAIKLLRRSMDSEAARERFRRERQILAGLEHPSIARLLDGGTVSAEDRVPGGVVGTPYLIMEYVEGLPIDLHCDRRRATLAERCALMADVCDAVHAAHTNLVVHRDLKPSNILVDEQGRPRLLDFGIARLLNPELSAASARVTAPGQRPMTPTCASPEQVRGEPITTASDVYALGVLLYELLTGLPPYLLAGRSRAAADRVVCEVKPTAPSRRAVSEIKTDAPAAEERARRRRMTPAGLQRGLGGDLDAITLMALRKEPHRRYASAGAMAEDLRRHLRHGTVVARRESTFERMVRLARRNRLAAALLACVVVLAAVMTGQTLRLRGALAHAEHASTVTDQARAESDLVLGFLEELLEQTDPVIGDGTVVSGATGDRAAIEVLLMEGADRARLRFHDRPAVLARVLDTIGMTLRHRGRYDDAQPLLEAGLALREAHHGPDHPAVATSLDSLGQLFYGRQSFDRAVAMHRRALAIRRQNLGADHVTTAESMHNLAEVLLTLEQREEAEDLLVRGLAIRKATLGDQHAMVVESMSELAFLRHDQKRYDQAETLHRQVLAMKRGLYGHEHAEVASALDYLAWTLQYRDELAEAERLYREALAMRQRLLGPDHQAVASSLDTLGRLRYERGDNVEAEALLRSAVATWRRGGTDEHAMLGTTYNNLALVLVAEGEPAEAIELYERTLVIYRLAFGGAHSAIATVWTNLGRARLEAGDLTGAEAALQAGLEVREQVLAPGDPDFAKSYSALGGVLARRGEVEGERLLRAGLALLRDTHGDDHWRVHDARSQLGLGLVHLGQPQEGAPLLDAGYERLVALRGDHDPATRAAADRRIKARRDADQAAPVSVTVNPYFSPDLSREGASV